VYPAHVGVGAHHTDSLHRPGLDTHAQRMDGVVV
jgi:hypothetical protein